jgi:2-C-methyl-D-erythritol 2,4-cyclodiphosphate synthase
VTEAGFAIVNVDSTIIAQQPKLAPYLPQMKVRIAAALEVDVSRINIKGKTNEKLGYLGREEAIETQAICLLQQLVS